MPISHKVMKYFYKNYYYIQIYMVSLFGKKGKATKQSRWGTRQRFSNMYKALHRAIGIY